MDLVAFKKLKLPKKPGVYLFYGDKNKVLYVGKATFLRDRVRSYFDPDLPQTRGLHMVNMVLRAKTIKHVVTESALEALLLEAALIKKHRPPYNSRDKDDKSFQYAVITKEDFPRILLVRGRELFDPAKKLPYKVDTVFGPFPHGKDLKEALRIIRKILPFRDTCEPQSGRPCFNAQINLCPGVCSGAITKTDYKKTIRRIKLLFSGKKSELLRSLKQDMKKAAKGQAFEEAERIKRIIFGLTHIQDVALIKEDSLKTLKNFRIESYDIAHISGTASVGVMTVVDDGEVDKNSYRKFRIKSFSGADDTRALREILERRLAHSEWRLPRLFVIDGGKAQKKVAENVLEEAGLVIPVVSVVKDERHRPKDILGERRIVQVHEREILLANSEAHRFAISYHRGLRERKLFKE